MFFYVKVKGKSGIPDIVIDGRDKKGDDDNDNTIKAYIERIVVNIDTVQENAKNHASDIRNKVEIELLIKKETKDTCKQFMDWSLMTSGGDLYRTVHIDVYDDKNDIIRSFDLQEMFVEDCLEKYSKIKDTDDEITGVFTIKLIQMANKQKVFKQDVNQI